MVPFLVCGDSKSVHYFFGDTFWHFMVLTCYDLLHFTPDAACCMYTVMCACLSGSQKSSKINN